jgi:hypothetical protein
VVGAPAAKVGTNASQGAVYVFTQQSGGWSDETQAAKLTASDGAVDDNLGHSVAISGSTVVAGAPGPVLNGSQPGAVYVFNQPAGGWSGPQHETAKLTASDGAAGDKFGFAVGISGGTVAAGRCSRRSGRTPSRGACTCSTTVAQASPGPCTSPRR